MHHSGQTHTTGRITKAGRKDLRHAMVTAANAVVEHHPYWKKVYERMTRRMPWGKAVVAVARRLLIGVWHILTEEVPDRYADEKSVAASLFKLAYEVRVKNLPEGQSARAFTRAQLDRLGIGASLKTVPWGSKTVKLPPSKLKEAKEMSGVT